MYIIRLAHLIAYGVGQCHAMLCLWCRLLSRVVAELSRRVFVKLMKTDVLHVQQ